MYKKCKQIIEVRLYLTRKTCKNLEKPYYLIKYFIKKLMKQSNRSDKLKNDLLITKEFMKNPTSSQRKIALKLNLSPATVNRVMQELEASGVKSETIEGIYKKDLENLEKMQQIVTQKISDPEQVKDMKLWELSIAMKDSTARYTLFKWQVTDNEWGMKQPDVIFQFINPWDDNE